MNENLQTEKVQKNEDPTREDLKKVDPRMQDLEKVDPKDEDLLNLNFRHNVNGEDLVIAVAQDYETSEVLMVAFMNKEAIIKTLETGKAHYWSTSRGKPWFKGESSGHIQEVKEIFTDCDKDAVLLKVKQTGAACHEGYYSCFFREISHDNSNDVNIKEYKLKIVKDKVFEPEKVYGEK
ncbi:Phosphoribosyl-AMP cyclohydrolase [Methanobacterium paludis]|uniref:Phosphoribosyl-AMP cyclohydrolase n=2 Tax=Methanobacterium paludis (strain DSM 25820 / JCM 18151 / SWAN1) TaxID=868131 RepID=F6D3U9_METPW|nr:Phosphoribosyl-AMP cyclohydrolase [Methanobacterium paludis]